MQEQGSISLENDSLVVLFTKLFIDFIHAFAEMEIWISYSFQDYWSLRKCNS